MKSILQLLTGVQSYDIIRILNPLIHIKKKLKQENITVHCLAMDKFNEQIAQGYDVVCIHGVPSVSFVNILKKIPCVMFADDLMHELPKGNPALLMMDSVQLQVLDMAFEKAKKIIATTENLKKAIGYPDKTMVAPNLIDFKYSKNESQSVAFVGGNSHAQDIRLLGNIMTSRKLIFFTNTLPIEFSDYRVNPYGNLVLKPNKPNIGWIEMQTDYERYQVWMNNLDFGVGVCPLIDNSFNRCKSTYKFLEYLNKGAISVVTDISPYSDIPDDCCVKVTDNNWDESIELAFTHRSEIYEAASNWVFDTLTYEKNESWFRAYLEM